MLADSSDPDILCMTLILRVDWRQRNWNTRRAWIFFDWIAQLLEPQSSTLAMMAFSKHIRSSNGSANIIVFMPEFTAITWVARDGSWRRYMRCTLVGFVSGWSKGRWEGRSSDGLRSCTDCRCQDRCRDISPYFSACNSSNCTSLNSCWNSAPIRDLSIRSCLEWCNHTPTTT